MPRSILPNGIRSNNTAIRMEEGRTICRLHQTDIATLTVGSTWKEVTLNTGGWNTPTTIRRMNECLRHWGFRERVAKRDFCDRQTLTIREG